MMLVLQILRLALIGVVAVAYLARSHWDHFFFWVRINWLWLVAAYVVVTVAIRLLERRRRRLAQAHLEGPWTCEVCETENPGSESKCTRCTVPRP